MRYKKFRKNMAFLLETRVTDKHYQENLASLEYLLECGEDPNEIVQSTFSGRPEGYGTNLDDLGNILFANRLAGMDALNQLDEMRNFLFTGKTSNPVPKIIPLVIAIQAGSLAACDLLIAFGARVDFRTPKQECALSLSLERDNMELVERFLEFEQNLDLKYNYIIQGKASKKPRSLIYIAAFNLNYRAVKLLLEKGANPKVDLTDLALHENEEGRKILDLLKSNDETDYEVAR